LGIPSEIRFVAVHDVDATAVFAGQDHSIDELREALFDGVSMRQILFDARAREILENHLVGKVSSHLRD
jgi:hypothetical protein